MKKTLRLYFVVITIFCAGFVSAQDVTFIVTLPSQVEVGQGFNISFTIKTNGDKMPNPTSFKAPAFKDLSTQGPTSSQFSNTSYINGVRTSEMSISYTYYASAIKEGTVNIGSATVVVGGQSYKTEAKTLKVVKSSGNSQQNQGGRSKQSQGNQNLPQSSSGEIGKNDLFVKAYSNKTSPYEGEEVILSYKIYTAVSVSNYSLFKIPLSPNFWVEDLLSGQQLRQQTETIDGRRYITAQVRKVAAYPQMSGKQRVEPLELEAVAQVQVQSQRPSNDPFAFFDNFFGRYENRQVQLKSNAVVLNVKPLPAQGKPESFKGAVGNYNFKAEIDKTKLKSNDAVSIKITVSGKGNLKHVQAPDVVFPEDFEVFDPQENENITINDAGMSGSKTFEYIAIPRSKGLFEIPEIKFSYFNPNSEKYIEQSFAKQQITVEQDSSANSSFSSSDPNSFADRDIEFIKNTNFRLHSSEKVFLFSPIFWGLFVLIPVLLFVFWIFVKKMDARNADIAGLKRKKALKEAQKCLKKANKFMLAEDYKMFYNEISQALWGFLSNKFNIPIAELSVENVQSTLQNKKIKEENIVAFIEVLNDCEFARFAPNGHSSQVMSEIYTSAFNVISEISILAS